VAQICLIHGVDRRVIDERYRYRSARAILRGKHDAYELFESGAVDAEMALCITDFDFDKGAHV
jgi:hypothetical protein